MSGLPPSPLRGERTVRRVSAAYPTGPLASKTVRILTGWTGRLVVHGAVVIVSASGERVGLNWGGGSAHRTPRREPGPGRSGVAVCQAAVTLGRLDGDRNLDRVGPVRVFAAGTSGNTPVPVAVARISTLGYLGSLTAPAVIGYAASTASLPIALLLPPIAVAATAFAARVVRSPRPRAALVDHEHRCTDGPGPPA